MGAVINTINTLLELNNRYYFSDGLGAEQKASEKAIDAFNRMSSMIAIARMYSKNDGEYGFANCNIGDIFCHSTRGDIVDKQLIIVHYDNRDNGKKRGKRWCHFNYSEIVNTFGEHITINVERLCDKLYEASLAEEAEYERMRAILEDQESDRIAKRNLDIKDLGIGEFRIENQRVRRAYGPMFEANFIFDVEIDEKTFKRFLEINELVVEAKPCYAPISPEEVHIQSIPIGRDKSNTWYYKWLGEYTD